MKTYDVIDSTFLLNDDTPAEYGKQPLNLKKFIGSEQECTENLEKLLELSDESLKECIEDELERRIRFKQMILRAKVLRR